MPADDGIVIFIGRFSFISYSGASQAAVCHGAPVFGQGQLPQHLRTKTDDPEGAILEAVASGRADAGILPACYVERLSATDPKRLSGIRLVTTDRASQTRCRSFSVFYPGWTLASFPHTPPELNALVSGTLLGMPTDADGCDWRPGARYDAVHELLEALGDAAYLRQSQFSWEAFVASAR